MKINKLIIALVLVVVAVIVQIYNSPKNPEIDNKLGKSLANGLYGGDFDQLKIISWENSVTLEKKNSYWRVKEQEGYLANTDKISRLLDDINTTNLISRITENKEKFGKFKLFSKLDNSSEDKTGTFLSFRNGDKQIFGVVIGEEMESSSTQQRGRYNPNPVYVRLLDNNTAYLMKNSIYVEDSSDSWVLKEIAKIESEKVKNVIISNNKQKVEIERNEKDKKLRLKGISKKEKVKDNELKNYLKLFDKLSIEKALPANSKEGRFSKNTVEVKFTTFEGSVVILKIDKKESDKKHLISVKQELKGGETFLASEDLEESWVFLISAFKAKNFLKNKEDFLKNK